MHRPDLEDEQSEQAAAEAAEIGGRTSSTREPADDDHPDEAHRPLAEAGQGESEGFEEAERELVENASHGDQHAARRILQDAPLEGEDDGADEGGEADRERSSERPDDDA